MVRRELIKPLMAVSAAPVARLTEFAELLGGEVALSPRFTCPIANESRMLEWTQSLSVHLRIGLDLRVALLFVALVRYCIVAPLLVGTFLVALYRTLYSVLTVLRMGVSPLLVICDALLFVPLLILLLVQFGVFSTPTTPMLTPERTSVLTTAWLTTPLSVTAVGREGLTADIADCLIHSFHPSQ